MWLNKILTEGWWEMIRLNKNELGLIITLCSAVFFLGACGPAQADLDATSTQAAIQGFATQTASAPTDTPTPEPTTTPTPTVTYTPMPSNTPSPTFTPTPTPEPDPNAMLNWSEIGLPNTFNAIAAENIGIGEGDEAFSVQLTDGSMKSYTIETGFAFATKESSEIVYGYTALFSTDLDRDVFDSVLQKPGMGFSSVSDTKDLSIEEFGDISRGISGKLDARQRIDIVNFRLEDIGAFVFIRYPEGSSPPVAVEDLARVYAESIENPTPYCSLVSITPVEGATWPSFDYQAEGFYPGERRLIVLEGEVTIGGKTETIAEVLAGLEGETADDQGRVQGNVTFGTIAGTDISPPSQLTLTITGYWSGCELKEIIEWQQ